jgi:uncharacterized protein YegP (UPF0339 family)
MTRQPRFEICRGDDGWWARFRAANGRIVWVTETYERRRAAVAAVELICEAPVLTSPFADWPEVEFGPRNTVLEVREVDER